MSKHNQLKVPIFYHLDIPHIYFQNLWFQVDKCILYKWYPIQIHFGKVKKGNICFLEYKFLEDKHFLKMMSSQYHSKWLEVYIVVVMVNKFLKGYYKIHCRIDHCFDKLMNAKLSPKGIDLGQKYIQYHPIEIRSHIDWGHQ